MFLTYVTLPYYTVYATIAIGEYSKNNKLMATANYNCTNSSDNAYGAGSFGTCTGQTVGAPDTGVFQQMVSGGSFTVILPLAAAIIITVIATIVIKLRNKKAAN